MISNMWVRLFLSVGTAVIVYCAVQLLMGNDRLYRDLFKDSTENAQSQYNVFSVLSEAVNQYEKSIGFGISGGINITEKASIDKTILEKINNIKTLQKQKFDNLEDKEDGFYSYCYEV